MSTNVWIYKIKYYPLTIAYFIQLVTLHSLHITLKMGLKNETKGQTQIHSTLPLMYPCSSLTTSSSMKWHYLYTCCLKSDALLSITQAYYKVAKFKGTAGTGQTLFLPSVMPSLMMFKRHHIPGYKQEVR